MLQKSKSKSAASDKYSDEIDQDIKAGNSEVEDFAVEVPANAMFHQRQSKEVDDINDFEDDIEEMDVRQSNQKSVRSRKGMVTDRSNISKASKQTATAGKIQVPGGLNPDSSVQMVEDNYYIDDFDDNGSKQSKGTPQQKIQNQNQDPHGISKYSQDRLRQS